VGFLLAVVSTMETREQPYLGIHIGERLPRQGGELLARIVGEHEYLGS